MPNCSRSHSSAPIFAVSLSSDVVVFSSGVLSGGVDDGSYDLHDGDECSIHELRNKFKIKVYEEAYLKNDHTKKRRGLALARAARESLKLERQLALQRIKETEVLLSIYAVDADDARMQTQEADMQVGRVGSSLDSEGIMFSIGTGVEVYKAADPDDILMASDSDSGSDQDQSSKSSDEGESQVPTRKRKRSESL